MPGRNTISTWTLSECVIFNIGNLPDLSCRKERRSRCEMVRSPLLDLDRGSSDHIQDNQIGGNTHAFLKGRVLEDMLGQIGVETISI